MAKAAICIIICLVTAGFVSGATIYVPTDQPTIQDALTASVSGDVIIVEPGTYVENIDFLGKNVTLRSEKGPSVTIIDGNKSGSVVTFDSGEGPDAVLEGFTITNGQTIEGGGIRCDSTSPTIRGNRIKKNFCTGDGAGIYCWFAEPLIDSNAIYGNVADDSGGGIHCFGSDAKIVNNTISGNTAVSNPWSKGGGFYCSDADPVIANNVFSDNLTRSHGGAIYGYNCSSKIASNTIIRNEALDHGGGIALVNTEAAEIFNTILWDNEAPQGPEAWVQRSGYMTFVTLRYCNVMGGKSRCWASHKGIAVWGPGMIDADPLLVHSVGDFHLTWNSPCRNAGASQAPRLTNDFEGDPRISDGIIDIGADEFHPHLYFKLFRPSQGLVPGAPGVMMVTGPAGMAFTIAVGPGVRNPPLQTAYGKLRLTYPIAELVTGVIQADGTGRVPMPVPAWWVPGEQHHYQAMVGPTGVAGSRLTNLLELTVE